MATEFKFEQWSMIGPGRNLQLYWPADVESDPEDMEMMVEWLEFRVKRFRRQLEIAKTRAVLSPVDST